MQKKIVKSQTAKQTLRPKPTKKVLQDHSSKTLTLGPRKKRRVENYQEIMSKLGYSTFSSSQMTSRVNMTSISSVNLSL